MSTVGTLYDETVKFGYAKLLQTQNIPGGTVYAIFTTPFSANYDVYMFEIVAASSTVDGATMGFRLSYDGGATQAGDGYWWTQQYNYSTLSPYGSMAASQPSYDTWVFLTSGPINTTPVFGEVYVHRDARPFPIVQWETVNAQGNVTIIRQLGGCMHVGTGSGGAVNGICFFFNASTFRSGSIIRCFGIKKGIFGS